MEVRRYLGSSFAAVHGPSAPEDLLLWALDQGFVGLLPSPSPRAVDWRACKQVRRKLPIQWTGVRVSGVWDVENLREGGLASAKDGDQALAQSNIGEAVALASYLGSGMVILEPGLVPVRGKPGPQDLGLSSEGWTQELAQEQSRRRSLDLEASLDRACRALHILCKSFPDMTFCLTSSRNVRGLGDVEALAAIFEDLPRQSLAYWHDTVSAASRQQWLGENPGEALDRFSNRLQGMTLGDVGDGALYLPPGTGGVDYPLLSAYRQQSAKAFPVVVELNPSVHPSEIPGIHAFLNKFGL